MSLCINNDLIWIAIPKNASVSIEHALLNSNLNIQTYHNYKDNSDIHGHLVLNDLYSYFGVKETVCISRDWFERWLSGLEFVWERLNNRGSTTIVPWNEVDNQLIYKIFDDEFLTASYNRDFTIFNRITKYPFTDAEFNGAMISVFLSQNHWKMNKKCTYEFNINEMGKFEKFIKNRYGETIDIEKTNSTKKTANKIVINDELKNWIWNVFEKKYIKSGII